MSGRQTIDYDPVEALLDQGRRDLAAGQPEKARWCFEEVLRRRPTDARALLGMSYVERHSERPIGDGASILNADLEVVKLVKDKRYDEALDLLRRELLARPGDEALQKSITHLQRHITRRSGPPPANEPVEEPVDQGQANVAESAERSVLSQNAATPPDVERGVDAKRGAGATRTKDSKRPKAATETKDIRPPKAAAETLDMRAPKVARATKDIRRPKVATETKDIRRPKSLSSTGSKATEHDAHAKASHESSVRSAASHDSASLDSASLDSASLDAASLDAASLDAAPTTGVRPKSPPAPRESDNDLDVQSPMRDDLGSSGGVRLADELPSGPALGSLPPSPAPLAEPAGSGVFWLVLLVAVAVAVAVWALRA